VNYKIISPSTKLAGTLYPPGDKSISHRVIMLASLAEGESTIQNFLQAGDCLSTVEAFKSLGVPIQILGDSAVRVTGQGMKGFKRPPREIYVGNSGTTMRLLLGILAGQSFIATLSGDESISKRPMKRVTDPLREMGAKIQGPQDANFAPLTIKGGELHGIEYTNEIASAQVKSAILLAGLYAEGETTVKEILPSRDHTERMLALFGAHFQKKGSFCSVLKTDKLKAQNIHIPGDVSSAAFFIVAALLTPDSDLVVKDVILNPTRIGFLSVLQKMGARLHIENVKGTWEPMGDIRVKFSRLQGVRITKKMIPSLIDELPILMVACSLAEGKSEIRGAEELRFKETDRIQAMCKNLAELGVKLKERPDGCIIHGTQNLKGGVVDSFGDHRVAMSMAIAGLRASAEVKILGSDCVSISYPSFFNELDRLGY